MPVLKFSMGLGICTCLGLATAAFGDSNGADIDPCEADFNGDSLVDGADLGQLLLVFGKACNNCCFANGGLGCNDDKCEAIVCGQDAFCCDVAWDVICASEALRLCESCGDGGADISPCNADLNDDGIVDGADLGQLLLVFHKGCTSCCFANGGVGCNDDKCEAIVCAFDPFCCGLEWDAVCAAEAATFCDGCGGTCGNGACDPGEDSVCPADCPSLCGSSTNDCCAGGVGPGCSDAECCDVVCAVDPFCCDVEWDGICADEAGRFCEGCGGTSTPPENDNCADRIDLGAGEVLDFAFDNLLATTDGPPHPFQQCEMFGETQIGSDIWYNWTSNRDGAWTFSLCGSGYDTEIAVYNGCGCPVGDGNLLACNDDSLHACFGTLQSSVSVSTIDNGNCYKIRIGGFNGAQGEGVLSITQGGPPADPACETATGDCCTANGGLGCHQPDCCASVCNADPFCCDVAWDGVCASEAETNPDCDCLGGAGCGKSANDCCAASPDGTPSCSDETCCDTVCDADPFCCNVLWDGLCAGDAADLCGDLCR